MRKGKDNNGDKFPLWQDFFCPCSYFSLDKRIVLSRRVAFDRWNCYLDEITG